MVRETLSRRSLVATVAASTISVAGCMSDGSCRTVFDGTELVEGDGLRVYDADVAADERLYVACRRLDGPQPTLTVFDPDEEPVVSIDGIEEFERVVEVAETGTYAVVTTNESGGNSGRWKTTVVAYRGWCGSVF